MVVPVHGQPSGAPMGSLAAGTIVAKPYLSFARVLARSFQEHHPGIPFFVLLADEVAGCFRPEEEPFELLTLADLEVPAQLRFWYSQQELSYATTPYLLSALLDRGYRCVVFFKQESLLVGDMSASLAAISRFPISLTPHLLAPLQGKDRIDRELRVLQSGAYNVGCLGVCESGVARRFLAWWQDRLYRGCRHDVRAGMHFEQRWLDLVPGYFPEVQLIRDPGVNVGHWNLAERPVQCRDGQVMLNDRPCRLIRFSGYHPDHPQEVSRYRPGWRVDSLGEGAQAVFKRYQGLLEGAGYHLSKAWPYAFGSFSNGVPIPEVARRLLAQESDSRGVLPQCFADPFDARGSDSFYQWLRCSVAAGGTVTPLWLAIHAQRVDLQRAFPDPLGRDQQAFANWTSSSGLAEHGIDGAFAIAGSR
ncbi:MAG: hypothetical protein NVSMB32_11240 [Actinomycetota bacterium]